MTHSSEIKNLVAAFLKTQNELGAILMSGKNPRFNSPYAKLEDIWAGAKDSLNRNGLVISQLVDQIESGPILITLLIHTSGEWIQSRAPLILVKYDPQALGSAITYMRRYSLLAILSLPTEDDDGNAATPEASNQQKTTVLTQKPPVTIGPAPGMGNQPPKPVYSTTGPVTDKQFKRLYAISNQYGIKRDLLEDYMIYVMNTSPEYLTKEQYNGLCDAILPSATANSFNAAVDNAKSKRPNRIMTDLLSPVDPDPIDDLPF